MFSNGLATCRTVQKVQNTNRIVQVFCEPNPFFPGPGNLQELCKKYKIPTAEYECFREPGAAKAYIQKMGAPIVVKANGLAAGKGVVVAQTLEEAYDAVDKMLVDRVFGDAGSKPAGFISFL
jgi:hypothetical protein